MDCIQLSLFGKMCPEHSVPTEEKISEPCWKNLPAWNNQTLQFLDLRVGGADGAKPEQSLETDGLWLGDSLTLNIGECPREENASLLSQILEVNVHQKYYLSARACQGILTRASRRGKQLPELLKTALLEMIEWWKPGASARATEELRKMEQDKAEQERKAAELERKMAIVEAVAKKLHRIQQQKKEEKPMESSGRYRTKDREKQVSASQETLLTALKRQEQMEWERQKTSVIR